MEEAEIKKFDLEDILKKIFIGLAVILLIISVWGVYMSLNEIISIWIGYKYAPIYRTLLNLAVLVLAIYVLNLLVRKRT